MLDAKITNEYSAMIAKKYLSDDEPPQFDQLIERMERKAYALAREGNSSDARAIFVEVATLELGCRNITI